MARIQKKLGVEDKKKKRIETRESIVQENGKKKDLSVSKVSNKPESTVRDTKSGEMSVFQKCGAFLREVNTELRKVTWPTKKQTMGTTLVVLIFVFVTAAFLGLFDYSLSKLVQVVLT